ncbi:MAG: hypothetical protein K0S72_552 [Arthrobacter sp.]|jgi:hypothetical protein|nr:hypothetical protein [Arthrobacter sp.]
MAIWGADIAQLKDLSAKLQAGARELENQKNMLGRALQNTDWKGPDADQFRNEWNTNHSNALTRVAQALEEAGKQANRNASQQEEASR